MTDLAVDGTPLWDGYTSTVDRDLRRMYGLKLAHYEQLLELQGGVCAVCGKPPAEGKRLAVDEDPVTRKIRGLLHQGSCNRKISDRLSRYLADPPAGPLGWTVPDKQWQTRAARNAGRAERHRLAREAAKAEPVTPAPTGLDRIRDMSRPGPTGQAIEALEFGDRVDRALADTAAGWSGGRVQVEPEPAPPREEAPARRRGLLGRLFS